MMPYVSVIVPCYNRADLIGRAITSVQNQTYKDWELIIVDDGSTDNIRKTVRKYSHEDHRIRLIAHSKNRGEPAARNTGINCAIGQYIAFLDSDDEWLPRKLEAQVEAVKREPDDNVFCVTQTIVKLSDTRQIIRPIQPPDEGRSFAEFLYSDGGFAQSSSFFVSRDIAKKFPFREDLHQMVDHLFFMEIGAAGARYLLVPQPLTIWHNEKTLDRVSMTDSLLKWRDTVKLFKKHAAHVLPPHLELACEARFLSGLLWKTSPRESIELLLRARRAHALTTRQITLLFCRNVLPPYVYDTLRSWMPAPESSYNLNERSIQR